MRPAVGEAFGEDASHDLEHGFEMDGRVDGCEGAVVEGGCEFAVFVACGAASFDDDHGGGLIESCEEVEEAAAAFWFGVVEGEGEIDDGDVDGELFEERLRFAA